VYEIGTLLAGFHTAPLKLLRRSDARLFTMSKNTISSSQQTNVITTQSIGKLSADSLERRRILLTSLGKGSVVLAAAAVPMHSLASDSQCQTDDKNVHGKHFHATASRCASPIGSKAPTLPVSCGHGCGHYKTQPTNWPGYSNRTSCRDKKFKDVFSNAGGQFRDKTCGYIVDNCPTSPECRWVLAYLNSDPEKCGNGIYNYPYAKAEIMQLWKGGYGLPDQAACQSFFGVFMETMG
jgi:hypothetical protein